MKVFLVPSVTGDKEWKLDDFMKDEKWKGELTQQDIQALDFLPMGGELEIDGLVKKYKILRIL